MEEWIKTFSKRQIDKAGLRVRDFDSSHVFTQELDAALDVLGAWRSSHTHPLQTVYMTLRTRAKRIDLGALAYQRLKRTPSIITKLQRNRSMKLTTMQDLGGCRAVLADVASVRELALRYQTTVRDYITTPKPDGYRSIHLVETYQPTIEKHEIHAGKKIEIQLRSELQHAWATAVETVDSLLGEGLKVGGGGEDWKRFFVLASSVIATREQCAVVPGVPESEKILRAEIREIADRLDVLTRLHGLASTVEQLPRMRLKGTATFVLRLDLDKKKITCDTFGAWELGKAAARYLELEKMYFGNARMQVVQVSVNQVRDLRRAFPNYYLNAQAFLQAIEGFM